MTGMPDPHAERVARARAWFTTQGRQPFGFQEEMWRAVWAGESGLLNASTGSGKTLAAWLGPALEDTNATGLRVLWITPLRALARDLEKALQAPLRALGSSWRVEQRTGDTSWQRRARQRTAPPQALITTPESLSVMLSYADARALLGNVTTVIVDEWHEFLGNKRGVQLELALARLRAFAFVREAPLRVWGLSATLPDLAQAMTTLLGPGREGRLIRAPQPKRYDIDAILPATLERFPWAGHLGLQLLPQVIERILAARTSLVFTNTRSQAEIWYQAIVSTRLELLTVTALHHGSIDAKLRRQVEEGLKSGALRCVVCTSSLDLGVDFPPVDQVLQIGSPRSVARLLQRAGRSGHRPGETSRVTVVPTHAWELVECAAARHAAEALDLEPRRGLTLALDVLAQHLVTIATGEGFYAQRMLDEARGTHAFAQLSEQQWQWDARLHHARRQRAAGLSGVPARRAAPGWRLSHRRRRPGAPPPARHRHHHERRGHRGEVAHRRHAGHHGGVVHRPAAAARHLHLRGTRAALRAHPRFDRVRAARKIEDAFSCRAGRGRGCRCHRRWAARWSRCSIAAATASCAIPSWLLLAPLLEVQARWSRIPRSDEVLVEYTRSREGHHLFVYPFAGRLLNEGVATVIAARAARAAPRTFSITTNEYGFELLCEEPLRWMRSRSPAGRARKACSTSCSPP